MKYIIDANPLYFFVKFSSLPQQGDDLAHTKIEQYQCGYETLNTLYRGAVAARERIKYVKENYYSNGSCKRAFDYGEVQHYPGLLSVMFYTKQGATSIFIEDKMVFERVKDIDQIIVQLEEYSSDTED